MPINNITQTISELPAAGRRGVDVQTLFVTKQEDFQDHLVGTTVTELNTLKDQLNTRIGEINSTVTTMNGYADTASAGASTATTKAGEASTSASGALTSRNQAETFKNNASASATKASQWADNNYNVEVEAGKYSAKHWSVVAENATSGKIDKVTSTDNAIVRFNGTTGDVQNSSITVDDNGNIGSGTQSFNGFGGTGLKNYIINGDMIVTQRGPVFLIPAGANAFTADRWYVENTTTQTLTVQCGVGVTANLPSGKIAQRLRFSFDTAPTSGTVLVSQKIEDVTKIVGLFTQSCVMASAEALSINYTINQNFGTYGSSRVQTAFPSFTIDNTNVTRKATISVPSVVGKTIGANNNTQLIYSIPIRTTNGLTFTQVQLEEGSVATPFEQRPYGLELSLCQRYYEKVDSERCNTPIYGTGTGFEGLVRFKVEKRIAPTIVLGSASHWRTLVIYPGVPLSTLGVQEITAYDFGVTGTSSSGNIPAGFAGKIQVNDGYTNNGTDGIFVSAEL